jgi:hypothetical protein
MIKITYLFYIRIPFMISISLINFFAKINKYAARYTRNKLKKSGFSLAFFDNSALSDLGFTDKEGKEDKDRQQNFINHCKHLKIKPVVSLEVIFEFIKGIAGPDNERHEKNKGKKIIILRTLKDAGLIWMLPISGVKGLEFLNLQKRYPQIAHEFLYVFSQFPLNIVNKEESRKRYPFDLWHTFWPDKATLKYDGDIEKWLKHEMFDSLSDYQDMWDKDKNMDISESQQITKDNLTVDYSPFCCAWNCLEKREKKENKKSGNERLDTLHAAFSLSYCDYFVVNDTELRERSKGSKNELNLNVSIETLDDFLKIKPL